MVVKILQFVLSCTRIKDLSALLFSDSAPILSYDSTGRGGSSSGCTSDYGLRGPGFDSRRCELGFFLSSLSHLSISGASLIRLLVEVRNTTVSFFFNPKKNGG